MPSQPGKLTPYSSLEEPLLAFSSSGQGEPTLVLIHGAGQDRHMWDRVTPLLEARHRVVRVDLPGHGESPQVTPFSLKKVAAALDRTLDRQKVKKAVLVGQSYGAYVALEEAAAHPSRASGLVPIDLPTYIQADSERIGNLEMLLRDLSPVRGRRVPANDEGLEPGRLGRRESGSGPARRDERVLP